MKNKSVKVLLSLTLAASLCMSSVSAAFAAEAVAAEAETETETEAEGTEGTAETAEDFVITLAEGDLTVKNQTSQTITKAELTEAEAKAEEKEETEETAEESTEEAEKIWNLVLTEEDGTVHTFENVNADKWKEPTLINSYEFLYVKYTDESGKEQEAAETAQERTFDEPITMYVSANVHIRKEADKEAESLKVAALGEELKVTAAVPGWFKVESGDITGYTFHSYVTEDKAAVDALVKAKQEAEAAAAAAAQAAAAQAAAAQQAAAQAAAAQPAAKTEVSRQAYDDCDGSGHGYYEITWSDGSVTYEEY